METLWGKLLGFIGYIPFLVVLCLMLYGGYLVVLHMIDAGRLFRPEIVAFLKERKLNMVSLRQPMTDENITFPYEQYDRNEFHERYEQGKRHLFGRYASLCSHYRIIVYEYEGYRETAWIRIITQKGKVLDIDMKIVNA